MFIENVISRKRIVIHFFFHIVHPDLQTFIARPLPCVVFWYWMIGVLSGKAILKTSSVPWRYICRMQLQLQGKASTTIDASTRERITKLLTWSWHQILVKYFESNSWAIRQKGESQNECYKEVKHAKFSEKRLFLTPVSGDKKCSFFRKIWRASFSYNTHFEIRPLPYCWRITFKVLNKNWMPWPS